MSLIVPPPHTAGIKALIELPDDKIDGFLTALNEAGPQFNGADLSAKISKSVQLPRPLTQGIVDVLLSLYRTRDETKSVETFLDRDVYSALKRAGTLSLENEGAQWSKLRKFFLSALTLERTIGTTAKAGPVLTEHERIFSGVRIMTDLRPIYHLDIAEKPDAALIIHMLKITQRDKYGHRTDLYFAMDSNDIAAMKEVIERATQKEETLRKIMKDSGVNVLDVKSTY